MIHRDRLTSWLVLLASLGSCSLRAGEGARFGLQASLNDATGGFKTIVDNKVGWGVGTQITIDLNSGHLLRPRLDYVRFPTYTKTVVVPFYGNTRTYENKNTNTSLGLDYLYFLNRKPQGFYLTGGLSANYFKNEGSERVSSGISYGGDNVVSLGVAIGLGYQFQSHFGLETRYTSTHSSNTINGTNVSVVNIGATFRF